ncbi:MAG: TM2 domain-containing protein [Raoultibacter sp.]
MDTDTPNAKTKEPSEFVTAEAELEDLYAQLEAARQKLDQIKGRSTSQEAFVQPDTSAVAEPEMSETADEAVSGEIKDPGSSEFEFVSEGEAAVGSQAGESQPDAGAYQVPNQEWQQPSDNQVPFQTPPVPPYGKSQYSQVPPQTPPQQTYYQQPYYQPQYVQTKDHVAAGLLAIVFGSLGIHKFYMGYNTAGFIMLAVTIIGSIVTFGLAGAVMALIGLIEGIVYLTKSQSDFEQVYVFNKREWF